MSLAATYPYYLANAPEAPNHDLERQLDRDLGGQDLLDAEAPRE